MKLLAKAFGVLVLALLYVGPIFAQNTAIQATILDPSNRPYNFATGNAVLRCPGNQQPTINGSPVLQTTFQIVGVDGNGHFTMTVWDLNVIQPTGCWYTFNITWQDGITNFITGAITGVTGAGPVNLSTAISAYAVPLPPIPGGGGAPATSTYITSTIQTPGLPNSRVLTAGTNITISNATPGETIVNSDAGGDVTSVFGRSGAVTAENGDYTCAEVTDCVTGSNSSYQVVTLNPAHSVAPFGTTGTISATSTTLALASASSFQNGDYAAIYGAGPTNTMSRPSVPTVTPGSADGLVGSHYNSALSGQSTSYAYEVACEDQGGGWTEASTAGTTTFGAATLGPQTPVSVSSVSKSGTIATLTLATSVSYLHAGTLLDLTGFNNSASNGYDLDGWYLISTVIDGTHIQVIQTNSTAYPGATASDSGEGQIVAYLDNAVTWTHVTGSWLCAVYETSPSARIVSLSRPDGGPVAEDEVDDFGSAYMGNTTFPAWVPSTPPAAATNDVLVAPITAGAGTTAVTLGTAATNSVTSGLVLFDESTQLVNACNSASGLGGPVYIPSIYYTIAVPFVQLPIQCVIRSAAVFYLEGTIALQGNDRWLGLYDTSSNGSPGSSFATGAPMYVYGGIPGFYLKGVNAALLSGMNLVAYNNTNQALLMLGDGVQHSQFQNDSFLTGSNSNDIDGTGLVLRSPGDTFDDSFSFTSFDAATQDEDVSWTPSVLVVGPVGNLEFSHTELYTRGFYWTSSTFVTFNYAHIQGPIIPFAATAAESCSCYINDVNIDSLGEPIMANLSGGQIGGYITLTNWGGSFGSSALGGAPFGIVYNYGYASATLGQNFNITGDTTEGQIQIGNPSSSVSFGGTVDYQVMPRVGDGPYSTYAFKPSYPTVSAAFSGSGSSFVAETYQFCAAPKYPSGNYGACSPFVSATATLGQNVGITLGAEFTGAVTWSVWGNTVGNGQVPIIGCIEISVSTTTCTGTALDSGVGAQPTADADGCPSFNPNGLFLCETEGITGATVGQFDQLQLVEGTCPLGISATDILCGDSSTHQLKTILNNGSALFIPTTDGSGVSGQCAEWTSTYTLIATGSGCGGGGGSGTVTSVAQSFTGGLISISGSPITTTGTLALTVAGTSGGIPYFSSGTTWASSAALTANKPVIGGGAGSAPTVGTVSGNTTEFGTVSGSLTSGHAIKSDASGNLIDTGAIPGTVTSAGTSFTGGLISVSGSPVTTTGTAALTVAGTSGGIPYFSSASTWASSAALTANKPVIGGGAGSAPTVGSASGNTTDFATTTGALVNGDCVSIDANSNFVDSGQSGCGGGGAGGTVTSVALAGPTGFGITGSPVITSGTLTFGMPSGWTTGDVLLGNGSNSVARLAIGASGTVLHSNGTTASWSAVGGGTVTTFSSGNLSPLFTTSVANAGTTPALSFTISNAGADTVFSNCTSGSAAPSFAGLTEACLPATTVFTDTANTFGAHLNDFSAATIKAPVAAGGTTSANGNFIYDSTNKNWHFYTNGADLLMVPLASGFTSGHCGQPTATTGAWLIADAGAACGTGTGPTLETNGGSNTSQALLNFTNTTSAGGLTWSNPSGGVEQASLTNVVGGGNSAVVGTQTGPLVNTQYWGVSGGITQNLTPGIAPNIQAGASYPIAQSDLGRPIFFTDSVAIAVTLGSPGSYTANFYFCAMAEGTGTVTITPASGTINGSGTLVLTTGKKGCLYNDGTNYWAMP